MKKILALIILTLIVPQIAFAAWWNPFSWKVFNNKEAEIQLINTEALKPPAQYTTFYIKTDGARIRSCASTSCETLGYVGIGNWVKVREDVGADLDSLPIWLDVNFEDIGLGYIHKSLLSDKPITAHEIAVRSNVADQTSLSAGLKIIKEWISLIDNEIQTVRVIRNEQDARSADYYTEESVAVLDEYILNISNIRLRLNSILSTIKSPSDLDIYVPQIDALTSGYERLRSQLLQKVEIAVEQSTIRARTDRNIRQQVLEDAYRQAQADLDYINQTRINATNAATQKYNELLEAAKKNGVTQSVFNAQLQGAGLIPQSTYCTSQPTFPSGGGHYTIICN